MGVRNIKKQLIGKEDLELGFGQIIQERNGKNLEIHRINAGIIPYTEDKSIAEALDKDLTVDTIADLRSISFPADTVWASGYHTKNDGAFGSHIFRLKGVKTTETDNGGTVIIATIGGTDYVYELQYDGAVNVKWFGAKGDWDGTTGTDDTSAIINALNYGLVIDGGNDIYLVSSINNITKNDYLKIQNINLVSNAKNESEFNLNITSTNIVEVENFSFNGNRNTKYSNDEKWYEIVGGQVYGKSVSPIVENILKITSPNIKINKVFYRNVFASSCIRVESTGKLSISDISFENTSFCTITSTGDSLNIKEIKNYYSLDNGRLPTSFLVKEIGSSTYSTVANRADRIFFNQGAFGARLMGSTNYLVNGFKAINYASSALVSDINLSFIGKDINIVSNSNEYISNNTTASIYSELTKDIYLENINIDIQNRNTQDSYTWGIYFYLGDNTYKAVLNNFNISDVNGYKEDLIHSVFNYGGNVTLTNGNLSTNKNSISTRINFADGYSGKVTLENIDSGVGKILLYDITDTSINNLKCLSDLYIGNYGAGGLINTVYIDNCKVNGNLSVVDYEGKIDILNSHFLDYTITPKSTSEKISNGDFSSTSNWVKTVTGGTFTASGNKATLTNTGLYQTITGLEVGKKYSVIVFNDRTSSTYDGHISIMSGTTGAGDVLVEKSGISTDRVIALEFTATATSHSIVLNNYANSVVTVYGRVSIVESISADVSINNSFFRSPLSNITGRGRSKLNISNSKFTNGGTKVFSGFNNICISNNYFKTTTVGASVNAIGTLSTIVESNTISKSITDTEPTYQQVSSLYSYTGTTVINNNNLNITE